MSEPTTEPTRPGEREFDLVLYGATGFVGKITAGYLAGAAPATARIALAGRSAEKLAKVRAELGATAQDWAIVTADAASASDVAALATRTRVVVTTVGPYAKYGLPLVEACAHAGTHYADLTGEVLFVRECIERFQEHALASGARIVHSCGYDSVPSDLGVYATYKQALSDGTGELTEATMVATVKGGMSGGTIASGRGQAEAVMADRSLLKISGDPYALSPDRALEPDLGKQSDSALASAKSIDPSLSGWVATFVMAAYNTRIVRRSNALLGWAYGKDFRYREVMGTGKAPAAPVVAAGIAGGLVAGLGLMAVLSRGFGNRILDRILPKPGTGPSEKVQRAGWFKCETFTRTSSGAKYRTVVAGKGDPGYAATSKMLGECGLALAFDEAKLSTVTGIATPATVMGDTLLERLPAAGLTITVERQP
ncbi:saccharopine dehydrogenase NADP-binding domain-containing protein [Aldersonia sp. NBC_00410]|uniref:saccharopine dehydrogenase family protein n=1 Tax=Aldersonia sp. NBC_00410 TaxID=2975954 RepID=UPI002257ED99|nr:saccharopine dehydrogenase NADP-binding domain-containing protein [Aldersonia sp. NBC_00410]MCX5041834.1 saccharopine dehydrogenase NADP-binding domain-containing protein [Aldersonia sp. NBC_00410]